MTEQELKEKIAFLFKIAREEGAIVKWADGQLDAEEVLALIKEALPELAKEAGYKSPEEVQAIYDSFLRSNSYTDSGGAEFPDK